MQFPVYIAQGSEPGTFVACDLAGVSVVATTAARAVAELEVAAARPRAMGWEPAVVELQPGGHPWLRGVGSLPDDHITRDWWAAVQDYRRQCDAAAGQP